MNDELPPRMAPEGQIWICTACGKTSHDVYGDKNSDHGWDASCMMNAVLVPEEEVERRTDGF